MHGRVLSWIVLDLRLVSYTVSFGTLAYLFFRHILALIWQVVRVSILRGNLLDRVSEFGRIDTKHALVDLVFEHEACIFLVHKFLHARCPKALISEGSVLFTLLRPLKLRLLSFFGSNSSRSRRFFSFLSAAPSNPYHWQLVVLAVYHRLVSFGSSAF